MPSALIVAGVALIILILVLVFWLLASPASESSPNAVVVGANGASEASLVGSAPSGAPVYVLHGDAGITPGRDMWEMPGSVEACQARCNSTPGCQGFTYKDGRCWGKDSTVLTAFPGIGMSAYTK